MQNKHLFSSWLEQVLPANVTAPDSLQLDVLAGDAGFRRYYRLNTNPPLIAVDSPPAKEKNPAYVEISLFLQSQNLRTPKIYAVDYKQGFMLLEDFGSILFRQRLDNGASSPLYGQAEKTLVDIQKATIMEPAIPCHDRAKLGEELALFEHWFLNRLLNYTLSTSEKRLLECFFEQLISSALEQPKVLVHADYHSRNLMILSDQSLGVIDFQDAMYGAITYDLVSLLKDCYVRWPSGWVRQRAIKFKQALEASGLLTDIDDKQFIEWFDLMGLQRHIKVLGIFSRLALRDDKTSYLNDIPLVIHYCLEASMGHFQGNEFNQWFKQAIIPLLKRQPWYSEYLDAQL